MALVELMLHLLDNEQLLNLYKRIIRETRTVTWPPAPEDEERKERVKLLQALVLRTGFERGLASLFATCDQEARAELAKLHQQTGGTLSDF